MLRFSAVRRRTSGAPGCPGRQPPSVLHPNWFGFRFKELAAGFCAATAHIRKHPKGWYTNIGFPRATRSQKHNVTAGNPNSKCGVANGNPNSESELPNGSTNGSTSNITPTAARVINLGFRRAARSQNWVVQRSGQKFMFTVTTSYPSVTTRGSSTWIGCLLARTAKTSSSGK